MSKPQLKEKDVNQSSNQRDLEADSLLNKHIFRTAAYGAAGFGVGLAASLVFFKHKAAMTALCAGAGAGYGLAGFASDWNKFKRDQNWSQAQKDRLQRNDEGQGKRTLDQFAFNQFSQSQKHQEQQKYGENQDRKRDEKRVERQKDDNRHHRDESSVQEKSQTKSENQGQQQRQDLKQGQQNKQQGQWKEKPLNPEAQQKQDIAEQRKDPHEANPEPTRMGKAPIVARGTQDKGKRVEEATHSQSMQGSQSSLDEVQHGERGPQNPSIPPSQRDWKGGHANQGVNQGQVHRGKPEEDRMGKPGSSPAPKTNQDKGSKPENQALLNVDLKGQQLQTFQSNPNPPGKAGPAHEINKVYQEGRNQANDPNLDNWKRQLHGMEQDRMGQSIKEGNTIKVRERSDTAAGVGNYRPGVAEQLPKNQVNADL